MKEKTQKGLSSLKNAFKHDLEARWRSKEELEAKLQWVLDRADKYAAYCEATRDEVLAAWESKRDSWWFGYYAEHKQPDPGSLTGYPVLSYQDLVKRGKELYGPDMLDWQFVCPTCGHVQTLREFHNIGIEPNYVPQLILAFAADKPADKKTLVPGDIVQIRGLEGPLNGKSGGMAKINEDGSVEVMVAVMKLDARNELTTNVSNVIIHPDNLNYDTKVTEAILKITTAPVPQRWHGSTSGQNTAREKAYRETPTPFPPKT